MKTNTLIALLFMYIFSFNCATSFAQVTDQYEFTKAETEGYQAMQARIEEYEKQVLKMKIQSINEQLDEGALSPDEAAKLKLEASEQAALNIQELNEIVDAYTSYIKRNHEDVEIDYSELDFSELDIHIQLDGVENLAQVLQELGNFFKAIKFESSDDYTDLREKREEVEQKRAELVQAREELKAIRKKQINARKNETPIPPTPPNPEDPNSPPTPDTTEESEVTKIRGSRSSDALVVAIGFNNALPDGGSLDDTRIRFGGSRSFEIGYARETRIFKNIGMFSVKYGVSFQFNGLKPEGNNVFAVSGDQTHIEEFDFNLRKNKFRMDNLIFPLHLQMGSNGIKTNSKGNRFYADHDFKVGIGGFVGLNLLNTNKLKYNNADGQRIKERIRDDYNTNNFLYGLSAYIGWDDFSFYAQYNLNPIFTNNPVDVHNIQFGVRFDLN